MANAKAHFRRSRPGSMRRRPLVLTIALALAGAPLAAVHAADIPVTSCADDGSPGTLRAAAASAGDGDTIDMTQLTCSTITVQGGPIELYQMQVTLAGPGQDALTIDGGGATSILFFYGLYGNSRLTLQDLTLANGADTSRGGSSCIDSFGGSLVLERTTIRNCQTYSQDRYAGSPAFWVNSLTMIDSTLADSSARSRNRAAGTGGGTAVGAILIRSTVSGNSAVGALAPYGPCGGGLNVLGGLLMVDSTVRDNNCRATGDQQAADGGGLYVEGNAIILRSAIIGNSTDGDGGGLFKGNSTNGSRAAFTIQSSTIADNSAGGHAGGLDSLWPVTIANSTIAGNYSGDGGAVLLHPRTFVTPASGSYTDWSDFESTIVAGNTSGPGATDATDLASTLPASLFGNRNFIGDADAFLALPPDTQRGDPQLNPLADNGGRSETMAPMPDSPVINSGANALGFVVDQRGPGFTRVVGGVADIGAYEVQLAPSPASRTAPPPKPVIAANRAPMALPVTSCADDGSPGTLRAVAAEAHDGDTLDLTQLTCGTITLQQGPIDLSLLGPNPLHSVTIAGPGRDALTISGNGTSAVFLLGYSGGYSQPGTITLSDLTVAHGAKYDTSACVSTFANATVLEDVTVTDCHTTWVGGGPALWHPGGGGAVSAWNLTLVDSTISDSSLTAVDRNVAQGGGAWAYYANITRSTISGNSLTAPMAFAWQGYQTAGGGIFTMRAAYLTDSTLAGNSAIATVPGEDANGGGAAALFGGVDLLRSTVTGNAVDGVGGGMAAGLYFYARRQPQARGAISVYDSTVAGNSARFGGAMAAAADMALYNSTVAFNESADGGAVGFVSESNWFPSYGLLVESTIIASNTTGPAPGHAADLAKFPPPNVIVIGDHNLIGAADPAITLPPDTLRDDPLLQSLAWNGGPTETLALAPESPAIDAGSNPLAYPTDQRGDGYARVAGPAADIGAFEVQSNSDTIFASGFGD